jgi:large subunit ribosomal protein L18
MKSHNIKKEKRIRRHVKIRTKVFGTSERPRLSIFKSNRHISAQMIDDVNQKTLSSSYSKDVKGNNMMEKSKAVGLDIASKAKVLKIVNVVMDRGGFRYIGCVKALADGAREGGLVF